MDPILTPSTDRFTVFPIKYNSLWGLYKKAEACFWTSGEIDFTADKDDWKTLNDNERYFLLNVLAFFAGSDGIVMENLVTNFFTEVQIPEARSFYALQAAIENIHGEVYSLLIDAFCESTAQKLELFNAIDRMPCVAEKAAWAMKWMDPTEKSFAHRLVAFAVVEGVFFSGSFCAIFWFKSRNLMVKTLGTSNELISRDEGMHTEFAIELYKHLQKPLPKEDILDIVKEAVVIEQRFITDSLPCSLVGMNADLMNQYIRFVADRLLVQLGNETHYDVSNPFGFMDTIGLDGKTNFFEKRVTEYQLASAVQGSTVFEPTEDF